MPNLFPLDLHAFIVLMLVFVRVGALYAFLPVLGGGVPKTTKAALALMTSMAMYPVVDASAISIEVDMMTYALYIVTEALIGVMTAYLVMLVFAAMQLAGYIMGFQIGFGIVNVVDPTSGQQVSISAIFLNMFAMLLFLTLNIHHFILLGFAEGFKLVPLAGFTMNPDMGNLFIDAMGGMLLAAAQLAAPINVTLLLKQTAMGVLARTVPQMNIFVVGFPVTIALGLFTLAYLMSSYAAAMNRLFYKMFEQIDTLYLLMV